MEFCGTVITGAGRGKNLGFPTANIAIPSDAPEGVWASRVRVDDHWYDAATSIGRAETFGEEEKKCETIIFDFDDSLYGQEITVQLHSFIRQMKHFDSVEELQQAITEDIIQAKKILRQQ